MPDAAPDEWADFAPQKATPAGQADPWADFNPGLKTPKEEVPKALLDRFSFGKLGAAAVEGAKAGYGEPQLQQSQEQFRELGIYRKPGAPLGWASGIQFANEAIMTPAIAAADAMLRAPNAALEAAGAMFGQAVSDYYGQTETDQAKARRDFAQMTAIAGLLATTHHPIAKTEAGADRVIGTIPKPQNFVEAAKIIAGTADPVVVDKLIKLHDDYGVNPSEVAHDVLQERAQAAAAPEVAARPAEPPTAPPAGATVAEPAVAVTHEVRPTLQDIHEADAKLTEPPQAEQAASRIAAERDRYGEEQPPHIKAGLAEATRQAGYEAGPGEGTRIAGEGGAVPGGLREVVGGGGTAEYPAPGAAGGVEHGPVVEGGANIGPEGALVPGAGERPGEPAGAAAGAAEPVINVRKGAPRGRAALPPEQWSLVEFLAKHGGIQPEPDTVAAFGSSRKLVPGFGPLFRKNGMSIDHALEAAVEGGYVPREGDNNPKPMPEDLRKLLELEGQKKPQFKIGQVAPERKIDIDEQRHRMNQALDDHLEMLGNKPEDVPPELRELALKIMEKDQIHDPEEAWERAVWQEQQDAAETNKIELEPIDIPGWDTELPGEPGTAPAGGAEVTARGEQPHGTEVGEPTRPTGGGNREPLEETNPLGISESLLSRDPSDLPKKYTAGQESEDAKLDAAAHSLGAARAGELPPIGVGGAGQPRANPYFTYDDKGTFAKAFEKTVSGWQKTFQPELVSDKALQADPLFARYKSATAMEKDGIIARSEEYHQFWRKTTDTERIDYMDRLERNATMPPEWRALAERDKRLLDEGYALEKEFGSKAGYVQDYFPHIWLDPDRARGFVNTKVMQVGPKWFQKERTFDLIRDGLDAGLRLKTTNPEDMVVHRLLSGADMRERMSLLKGLEEMGLAKIVKETADSDNLARQGWQPIDAPNREQWLLAPDVQPLWKNAVEAKGFWANEGAIGSAFRGWMAFKAVWVPIKLAISLFHPLHVLHINYSEGLARAWTQIIKGHDLEGALQSAMEGFYGPMQAAIPGAAHEGKAARQAWKIAEKDRTPEQRAAVDLMLDGGFVPEMSEQLRINAQRALEDALDNGAWLKAVPQAIRRGIEKIQAPIFQEWIPSLKAAAYLKDAQALLQRRPELLDDPIQKSAALRTISKSIDSRFGEMFYGGLFWDRYVKDSGIASFLSLGWNLGFAREFGGALLEPEFRLIDRMMNGRPTETRATIRDAQNKLPFVISYVASAALINGMMTYGFTGKPPEGLDWIFARVGGTNPDGSPRRITNMFYLREVPMLLKHIQERGGNVITGAGDMLWNKLMFQPVKEMLDNKDYYGSDIWDENGPVYMQAWQYLKHVFSDEMSPITISGAKRAYMTSGNWYEAELAMMGFGPAPSYVERDATDNRIHYLFERHKLAYSHPEEFGEKSKTRVDVRNELLMAQKNNDQAALAVAANKWMEAGGSRLGLSNILLHVPGSVSMFRALDEPDQQAVMKGATPAEQEKYKPYLKQHVALDAANLVMQAEKQRGEGNTVAAAATEQQMTKLITDAVANGQITSMKDFGRSLTQQLITRHAPALAAIIAQPKKFRGLYIQGQTP